MRSLSYLAEEVQATDDGSLELHLKGCHLVKRHIRRDPALRFGRHSSGPEAILLATGSELWVAVEAAKALGGRGVPVRVVSMPSWDLFDSQPESYRNAVLPPTVTRRLAVEAGVTMGWERYVGTRPEGGEVHGLDRFGFTPDAVVERVEELLAR